MIDLLLSVVLCHGAVPVGMHNVKIEARYEHTLPDGREYVFQDTQWVDGPGALTITAEGHPYYISARIGKKPYAKCSQGNAIFIDSFESGSTEWWSDASS